MYSITNRKKPMSVLNSVSTFIQSVLSVEVIEAGKSSYNPASKTIKISHAECSQLANTLELEVNEVVAIALLHEAGHSQQPLRLIKDYSINPLPAEEDAWDRAERLWLVIFGVKPSQAFYRVKSNSLNAYYSQATSLVWS